MMVFKISDFLIKMIKKVLIMNFLKQIHRINKMVLNDGEKRKKLDHQANGVL